MRFFLTLTIVVMTAFPAFACNWAQGERQTYFEKLPMAAMDRDVIAKVEVLKTSINQKTWHRTTQVKVIDAMRGVKEGQKITIDTLDTDCSRDPGIRKGAQYFVAGAMTSKRKKTFYGTWDSTGVYKGGENAEVTIEQLDPAAPMGQSDYTTLPFNQ